MTRAIALPPAPGNRRAEHVAGLCVELGPVACLDVLDARADQLAVYADRAAVRGLMTLARRYRLASFEARRDACFFVEVHA